MKIEYGNPDSGIPPRNLYLGFWGGIFVFEQQTKTMRELRISIIRKLIKERPAKMKPYNYLMMGIVIAVPMLPIIMTFLSMGW